MQILVDDLTSPEIHRLLEEHLRSMFEHSPAESCHALDLDGLRKPDITFWSLRDDGELMGCGAIKELDPQHGEIKSMRTVTAHLRKGVAAKILTHIIDVAKRRNYRRLSLETGSMPAFDAARRLYEQFGFTYCGPFGEYREDPYSVFMTKEL